MRERYLPDSGCVPLSHRQDPGGQAGAILLFDSATGRLYDVLYKDDLLGTNDWLPLTNDWPGDGGTMEFTAPAGATQRFYRVEVRLEE